MVATYITNDMMNYFSYLKKCTTITMTEILRSKKNRQIKFSHQNIINKKKISFSFVLIGRLGLEVPKKKNAK